MFRENMRPATRASSFVERMKVLLTTEQGADDAVGHAREGPEVSIAGVQHRGVLDDDPGVPSEQIAHSLDHGSLLCGREAVPAQGVSAARCLDIQVLALTDQTQAIKQ